MAKPSTAAPADDGTDDDDIDAAPASSASGDETGEDADGSDDEDTGEDVLLTVCKESDGTYSLIKGDEDDADGDDAAGSADGGPGGGGETSNKQSFDSVGALLKAILDLLNEDQSSDGGEGSSDAQFQSGFDENAPPTPASPIAQKY